ncbi:MAG: hypothetical protein EOP45_23560 [Sphingobacteriaceae bacterium]|nr:MAG: hypothetical protein EOP45_23560 [Sphingobacteriaceae bacterium]
MAQIKSARIRIRCKKLHESEMRARNMKSIEWPLHDCIFKLCSVQDFKEACNKFLTEIKIFLIKTPIRVDNEDERQVILEKYHCDELYGAHSGQKKMYAKMRQYFYWPKITKDIRKKIQACERCKLSKPTRINREYLVKTYTPQKPFDIIQIDTVGPLQQSRNGFKYAVTLQCELTKYLVIVCTEKNYANY